MVKTQGLRPKLISIAVASCFATGTALANPNAPSVIRGTVTFNQAGNLLEVTNSRNAIINWNSFSIGASEITRFIQPSSSSNVLNRVTGGDPSAILGSLQSNGRVFLINPNGVLFGAGSRVDVAGLVASSLNLSNDDFLANRFHFTASAGAGSVTNSGNITTTSGGQVYLVGPAVTNNGIITTPRGEVVLAAGSSVQLVDPGTPNLGVEIIAGDNEARNFGSIVADSGRIGIYAGLIRQSGTLRADAATATADGRIVLKATRDITLEPESVISASGATGGTIRVLAGDTVRVAGRLDASAPDGGNGGFIETSGANRVIIDPAAIVTTAAPNGQTGTWLIDPDDFIVGTDITGAALSTQLGSNNIVISSDTPGNDTTPGSGDILVNDAVSWSSNNSLTLTARRDVVVNQSMTSSGAGKIALNSGWDGTSSAATPQLTGSGGITLNAPIAIAAGEVHLQAGSGISQASTGAITANKLLAAARGPVDLDAALNMVNVIAGKASSRFLFDNDQALTVDAVGGVSGISVVANPFFCCNGTSASVSLNASGDLTVNRNITATAGFDGGEFPPAGSASVQLLAHNGGAILVQNNAVVSAVGASVPSGSTGYGGYGYVNLMANDSLAGGTVTVDGARLEAIGGIGRSGSGGPAIVNVYAGGKVTLNNARLVATGGRAFGMDSMSGYDGGEASLYVYSGDVIDVMSGSQLAATAGEGSRWGGFSSIFLSATYGIHIGNSILTAVGGMGDTYSGGDAAIWLSNGGGPATTEITSSTLQATGGKSTISYGGDAWISIMDSSEAGAIINNSTLAATGATGASLTGQGDVNVMTTAGDIQISGSTLRADGGEGSSVHLNAGAMRIFALNSTLAATGDGTNCCGITEVGLDATAGIDTSGSTLSALGTPALGGQVRAMASGGDIVLGRLVTDSAGQVIADAGGSILDGNDGLNIQSPQASLTALGGSIGSVGTWPELPGSGPAGGNPIETLVGSITLNAPSGEVAVINSGNLNLQGLTFSGNAAVGATGSMTLGGPINTGSADNLFLGANGGLLVNQDLTARQELFLKAGNLTILGSSVSGNNVTLVGNTVSVLGAPQTLTEVALAAPAPASASAANLMTIRAGTLNVTAGAVEGATASITGTEVDITADNAIYITGNPYASAQIEATSPNSINLTFPLKATGGYFVNGVEGKSFDVDTNSGFVVGGTPVEQVPFVGFEVTYGSPMLPPAVQQAIDQTVTVVNEQTDTTGEEEKKLGSTTSEDPSSTEGSKDKKDLPICS